MSIRNRFSMLFVQQVLHSKKSPLTIFWVVKNKVPLTIRLTIGSWKTAIEFYGIANTITGNLFCYRKLIALASPQNS
jgi:hypothetical protein